MDSEIEPVSDVGSQYADAGLATGLRVFWLPGCSSCVKVKEHLKRLNVPFESVSVATNPAAAMELKARGIRGVPCILRAADFVYAQSLEEVSRFIGLTYRAPRKDPAFLFEQWFFLLNLGIGYLEACPEPLLATDVLKERKRPIGQLAYHVYQIPNAFVHCMENREPKWVLRAAGPVDMEIALNREKLLKFARLAVDGLMGYWERMGKALPMEPFVLEEGLRSADEFLDRSSWHSAQHLRQIASVLSRERVSLIPDWSDDFCYGLSIPVELWE